MNDFIQEEVVDYSFAPPDRRFDDSPFFLPDFNGKEDRVEDILFMIDTSGSMSDDMIAAAYSEVKGATISRTVTFIIAFFIKILRKHNIDLFGSIFMPFFSVRCNMH